MLGASCTGLRGGSGSNAVDLAAPRVGGGPELLEKSGFPPSRAGRTWLKSAGLGSGPKPAINRTRATPWFYASLGCSGACRLSATLGLCAGTASDQIVLAFCIPNDAYYKS